MVDMENANDKRGLRDTKYLADFFQRSERRIQQLAKDKVIKAVKIKGVYYYELIPTIRAYIHYLQDIVDRRKKTDEDLEKERIEADIRCKRAKAEKAELDLRIIKAEVLESEDVQAFTEDLAATTKSLLTALPGRLAMDVMNVGSASEASALIEDAINEVLEELSNYEFDLDFYKQRVADRQGRRLENNDSDEQ